MAAVTPRKLWQAEPGDCVVMLAPCSTTFLDYVGETLALDVDQVDIVAPDEIRGVHALDLVTETGAIAKVTARQVISPFVLDAKVVDFADRTGLRVHPFTSNPTSETLAAVRLINTKRGFRGIATALGLPVAEGGYATTEESLASELGQFLTDHAAAIVKVDRSSNGYGNVVLRADDRTSPLRERVHAMVEEQGARACGWVYEEFLPFESVPSLEMLVDDTGVSEFYSCDQRTTNNAWTGMNTPAQPRPLHDLLTDAAHRIGVWLQNQGYRGIFDVDCGTFDGGYVVTEANVRRTGGTYLEELARRLRPGTPADGVLHWRADVRTGTEGLDFAAAVRALDRAGLNDPRASARVVLPVDTLALDGRWRYLVVGADDTVIREAEQELARILKLS
ncbi:preATP grasp domain-containing protein [Streptacidiphilus sp. PAMC 29251]